jgi:hypothetical protein
VQALKADKQRTCVDFEDSFAHLLDSDSDPISMHGFERQSFQDEHV